MPMLCNAWRPAERSALLASRASLVSRAASSSASNARATLNGCAKLRESSGRKNSVRLVQLSRNCSIPTGNHQRHTVPRRTVDPVFQQTQTLTVEMVGRLVQQQDIRIADPDPRDQRQRRHLPPLRSTVFCPASHRQLVQQGSSTRLIFQANVSCSATGSAPADRHGHTLAFLSDMCPGTSCSTKPTRRPRRLVMFPIPGSA